MVLKFYCAYTSIYSYKQAWFMKGAVIIPPPPINDIYNFLIIKCNFWQHIFIYYASYIKKVVYCSKIGYYNVYTKKLSRSGNMKHSYLKNWAPKKYFFYTYFTLKFINLWKLSVERYWIFFKVYYSFKPIHFFMNLSTTLFSCINLTVHWIDETQS